MTAAFYNVPAVGSRVTVTTRYPEIWILAKNKWRDSTYVGTVVAPDKGTPATSFKLHTGESKMPVREISTLQVHKLKFMDGAVAKKSVIEAPKTLQVTGSKGENYTVTKTGGKVRCTCPGFTFRNKCRHQEMI